MITNDTVLIVRVVKSSSRLECWNGRYTNKGAHRKHRFILFLSKKAMS